MPKQTLHTPKISHHPLGLLLIAALALVLGWSVSVINLAIPMGGPMALGGLYTAALGTLLGLSSLSILLLWLRNSARLLGCAFLIAACLAATLVFWQFWQYPTVNGAFYMGRDQLSEFSYIPPEPAAHLLAVGMVSALFYVGLEYAVLPTNSFFKANIVGKLSIATLGLLTISICLLSYPRFFIEPKLTYLSIPAVLAFAAILLHRFDSIAVLLGVVAVNFGLLSLLGILAYSLAL